MADKASDGMGIPWPALFALLVAGGGAYFLIPPLVSERPSVPGGTSIFRLGPLDVNARPWQDPFKAMQDHKAAMESKRPGVVVNVGGDQTPAAPTTESSDFREDQVHSPDVLKTQADAIIHRTFPGSSPTTQPTLLVLPVMISSSRQPEAAEQRLRTRQAVLEGLAVAGFVSEDPEHIGYVRIPWPLKVNDTPTLAQMRATLAAGGPWKGQLPVPYEWCLPTPAPTAFPAPTGEGEGYQVQETPSESVASRLWSGLQRAWSLLGSAPATTIPSSTTEPSTEPTTTPSTMPSAWDRWTALMRSTAATTQPSPPTTMPSGRPRYVLVLWLSEEAFSDEPLVRLALLINSLNLPQESTKVGFIGPQRLETLSEMARDAITAAPCDPSIGQALAHTTIYPATPTAAEDFLMNELRRQNPELDPKWLADLLMLQKKSCDSKEQPQQGLRVVATTKTDREVTDALVEELELRHIKVRKDKATNKEGDDIAVVLECDTQDARAVYYSMAASIAGVDLKALMYQSSVKEIEKAFPSNLHPFTYLRGIDGSLPSENAHQGTEKSSSSTGADGDAGSGAGADSKADSRTRGRSAEPSPDGYNQSDYVERLAEQLQEKDRELKGRGKEGLKAVGVLGSDLYDKLMILKVLRSRLPAAVFFTTTADARFALPAEWPAAHNLVIASSFGLTLNSNYQRSIPPFRDSRQTSVFAATLTATGAISDFLKSQGTNPDSLTRQDLLGPVRIFEVGRGRLFDLSPSSASPAILQPPRPDLKGWWTPARVRGALIVAAAGAALIGLLHLVATRQYEQDTHHPRKRSFLHSAQFQFAGLVVIAVAVVWIIYWSQRGEGKGEPFALFGGVSVWPSEALRLLAGMVSVLFLWRVRGASADNNEFIERHFHLTHNDKAPPKRVKWGGLLGNWDVLVPARAGSTRRNGHAGSRKAADDDMVDAQKLWDAYLLDNTWGSRMCRAGAATVAYYVVIAGVMELFGWPTAPCRGTVCWYFDAFNSYWFSVPAAIFLTFVVIDGTFTNRRFIRYLTLSATKWHKEAYEQCGDRGLKDDQDLRELLDIKLIAKRTTVVGEFIYFPSLILFLLLVSRNSYFDNWDWPPGVVIVYLASTLFAVASALMLRQSAEEARRNAAERLRERAIFHAANGDSGKADAVKECVAEIEGERGGAFSLLSQHPLLAALLLPSGGIGVWALLEYFASNVF